MKNGKSASTRKNVYHPRRISDDLHQIIRPLLLARRSLIDFSGSGASFSSSGGSGIEMLVGRSDDTCYHLISTAKVHSARFRRLEVKNRLNGACERHGAARIRLCTRDSPPGIAIPPLMTFAFGFRSGSSSAILVFVSKANHTVASKPNEIIARHPKKVKNYFGCEPFSSPPRTVLASARHSAPFNHSP